MASAQIGSSAPLVRPSLQQALQAWLARLGLSGKLLAGGALVGVIAVFLPLVTMSFQLPTLGAHVIGSKVNLPGVSSSQSVMVLRDMPGVVCLLGYVAALVLAFVLYQPNGLGQGLKTLAWAGLGVGAFIALLALWLLLQALSGSGGMMGFQISVGSGAILNLMAGATVAAGGFLKAREEIFPTFSLEPRKRMADDAIPAQQTVITAELAQTNDAGDAIPAQQPVITAELAQTIDAGDAIPIQKSAKTVPPARASSTTAQPAAFAANGGPPPLPRYIAQTPAADACDSQEDRKENPTVAARSASGFPVGLAFAGGGSVAMGVVVGLMMWAFRSTEPQPTNPAIVQTVLDEQDNDPAANEFKPDLQDKERAKAVLPKEKDSKPGNDVSEKEDKETAKAVLPKEKDSKSGNEGSSTRVWNLMSIVDLKLDLVQGKDKWRMKDQMLICDTGHFSPRVQIRYQPPEEYDFTVTFAHTRNLRHGVSLMMPKPGGGTFCWTIGHNNGSRYGFGPQCQDRGGEIAKLIKLNTLYTTTVQVRRNGVRGLLDSQLLIDHPTNFLDLTNDGWHKMPNDRVLGVGCDDPTTFHRISIVEVTGKGKTVR